MENVDLYGIVGDEVVPIYIIQTQRINAIQPAVLWFHSRWLIDHSLRVQEASEDSSCCQHQERGALRQQQYKTVIAFSSGSKSTRSHSQQQQSRVSMQIEQFSLFYCTFSFSSSHKYFYWTDFFLFHSHSNPGCVGGGDCYTPAPV